MKLKFNVILILTSLFLVSCGQPSLEKYYVDHQSEQNFIVLNIPSSIIVGDLKGLTAEQSKTLSSIKKANILAFPLKNEANKAKFDEEVTQVKEILASDEYKLIMKFNTTKGEFSVLYTGDPESIDEMIVFGASPKYGFGIARILGNNINPKSVIDLVKSLKEKDNINLDKIKELGEIF